MSIEHKALKVETHSNPPDCWESLIFPDFFSIFETSVAVLQGLGELLIFICSCSHGIICGFMLSTDSYGMNACSLIEAICLWEAIV